MCVIYQSLSADYCTGPDTAPCSAADDDNDDDARHQSKLSDYCRTAEDPAASNLRPITVRQLAVALKFNYYFMISFFAWCHEHTHTNATTITLNMLHTQIQSGCNLFNVPYRSLLPLNCQRHNKYSGSKKYPIAICNYLISLASNKLSSTGGTHLHLFAKH